MKFLHLFLLSENFLKSLDILWMGMLTIFLGIAIIYVIILILSKVKDRNTEQ